MEGSVSPELNGPNGPIHKPELNVFYNRNKMMRDLLLAVSEMSFQKGSVDHSEWDNVTNFDKFRSLASFAAQTDSEWFKKWQQDLGATVKSSLDAKANLPKTQ